MTGPQADTGTPPERPALVEAWTVSHGQPPPKGISTRLLRLTCEYDRQVQDQGGLSKSDLRNLLGYAAGPTETSHGHRKKSWPSKPSTGTRLVREWQGQSHVVVVMDKHILYKGQTYRSLSEVARLITGARWSGPRFFGV